MSALVVESTQSSKINMISVYVHRGSHTIPLVRTQVTSLQPSNKHQLPAWDMEHNDTNGIICIEILVNKRGTSAGTLLSHGILRHPTHILPFPYHCITPFMTGILHLDGKGTHFCLHILIQTNFSVPLQAGTDVVQKVVYLILHRR